MHNTTLFLDRDGVINRRIVGGYVAHPDEFIFIDGVLDAMKIFAEHFSKIIVVTNQQGIGKGLMTSEQLNAVHDKMVSSVKQAGGRIDHIYFCPNLKSDCSYMRKPNIGMALAARKDYPEINFKRSIMVGDAQTDMLFGRRAGMTTVLVGDEPEIARQSPHLVDYCYKDLLSFSKQLKMFEI